MLYPCSVREKQRRRHRQREGDQKKKNPSRAGYTLRPSLIPSLDRCTAVLGTNHFLNTFSQTVPKPEINNTAGEIIFFLRRARAERGGEITPNTPWGKEDVHVPVAPLCELSLL